MSRAFVREDIEKAEDLADLPLGPGPGLMTPAGLRQLQFLLSSARETLASLRLRPDRTDRHPEAIAEREIRYLEARLKSAHVIDPAAQPPDIVAFGAAVTVVDENGKTAEYFIVGTDEADPSVGRITPQAPLGSALIGAVIGDSVEWTRPAGTTALTVTRITYPVDTTTE